RGVSRARRFGSTAYVVPSEIAAARYQTSSGPAEAPPDRGSDDRACQSVRAGAAVSQAASLPPLPGAPYPHTVGRARLRTIARITWKRRDSAVGGAGRNSRHAENSPLRRTRM